MELRPSGKVLLGACALLLALTACQKKEEAAGGPGPAEQAGKQIDQAASKAGDELSKLGEKAGEKMQEAGKKLQEQSAESEKKKE
ncbi:hypothetical protein E4K72_21545 [Oxalobacteraceae bacterium OM1]|nr:hypothetical protein E4K72_21545 [Oxalobacteraceae bacterium OM1]